MRSVANSSFHSHNPSMQDIPFDSNTSFLKQLTLQLQQASKTMVYEEFNTLFKKIVIKCIKKAEVDHNFMEVLTFINKWMLVYSYDIQMQARIYILESLREEFDESLRKLQKAKYLLLDTNFQFLLTKVLVTESKVYEHSNNKQTKAKVLKKCIQLGESTNVQYLNLSTQNRAQICDNMIIAYFQMFKLYKQNKPNMANQYLNKAYQAAKLNYGNQHFSTQTLLQILKQQRNLLTNIEKLQQKPVSLIQQIQFQKNKVVRMYYAWQQELLVFELMKIKAGEYSLLCQSSIPIKMGGKQISLIKIKQPKDMFSIDTLNFGGDRQYKITINQNYIRKVIDNEQDRRSMPNLKQFEKGELYKRNQQVVSSSDEDILPVDDHQGQKFMKYFHRDRSHINNRSKSRDKVRENHTSRN